MHLNGKSAYFQLLKREWLEPIRRDGYIYIPLTQMDLCIMQCNT